MTWYASGQALPAGTMGEDFERMTLEYVRQYMPNVVPTTYDAADAYLREERKKPEGERDLLREMCVMIPLGLPKEPKISFVSFSVKAVIALTNGRVICSTTAGKNIHSPRQARL